MENLRDALDIYSFSSKRLHPFSAAIFFPALTDLLTADKARCNLLDSSVMLMPSSLTAQKHNKLRAAIRRRYFPLSHISDASISIKEFTRSAIILKFYPLNIK